MTDTGSANMGLSKFSLVFPYPYSQENTHTSHIIFPKEHMPSLINLMHVIVDWNLPD